MVDAGVAVGLWSEWVVIFSDDVEWRLGGVLVLVGFGYRVGGDGTVGVEVSWLCVFVLIASTRVWNGGGLDRVRGVGVRGVGVGVGVAIVGCWRWCSGVASTKAKVMGVCSHCVCMRVDEGGDGGFGFLCLVPVGALAVGVSLRLFQLWGCL